jgi:hypothetical protein
VKSALNPAGMTFIDILKAVGSFKTAHGFFILFLATEGTEITKK